MLAPRCATLVASRALDAPLGHEGLPSYLGPATRRTDAYRDGTLTRWRSAACDARTFSPRSQFVHHVTTHHVTSFIEEEALKLYERSDQAGVFGQYALPPAFVQVLDNAASFSELLPAALHVRKSYADLRHWTGKLQDVLDQEDVGAVLAQRKVLQSVAKNLSKLTTLDPVGDTSVQFGASWAKVTTKLGSPLNWASNRFGVRAQIKRLVLTPQGRGRFRKLLRFLGEDGTARGIDLERAWVLRQGAAASG